MDKRKSVLNVAVSISFKILTMIIVIIVKRFLIKYCGNDVNGLNALYLSIIGFLSVAELGVGSAITFCMYKPIVEGDNNTVSALYHLFRRIYIIIGSVILVSGLAITPFINIFAKDYGKLDVNLYITFILMLISVVLSYLYSCKSSLINAYKNNYITTAISSIGILFQYVLQIIVLIITRSFVWYLVCRIISVLLQWIATEYVARKKYSIIISNKQKIKGPIKTELIKNIKAMFMHRVGYILVNTVDSVVISTFVGVIALGRYSNYMVILTSLTEVLKLVFTSLTSIIGHLYVEEDKGITQKYSERFHLLNFGLGCIFFLGYFAIIDNLVAILFASELVVPRSISFVITLNGFVQFMRQSTLVFREATGTFYNDRYKPLFEGILNLTLSILFVKWLGIVGVIMATIITNLVICHVVEPYVLYKNAFKISPKKYYFRNYSMIILFTGALVLLGYGMKSYDNQWAELFANGFISIAISLLVCFIVFLKNKNTCKFMIKLFKGKREV